MLLSFDWSMVFAAFYLAFVLRYGTAFPIERFAASWPVTVLLMCLAPVAIIGLRLPWIKLSSFDMRGALRVAVVAMILSSVVSLTSLVFDIGSVRSIPAIFAAGYFALAIFGRMVALQLLTSLGGSGSVTRVAIFGAGAAGIQLSSALRQSPEVVPVCFFDDNPSYKGLLIAGLRVHPRAELERIINAEGIKRILVAIPSLDQTDLADLVTELSRLDIDLQVLPSYVDLIYGKSKELKTVAPNTLLGRDNVDLDIPEIAKTYAGRTAMVTGAGGSIGSELCKQLVECRPQKIVLFEQSEFALYEIEAALRPIATEKNIELVARLGSVCNAVRVEDVLTTEKVEVVLHAAAYKHVPMVEDNEVEGARNNVLGTQIVAEAANKCGVDRFILISTDKAVRPTNVMGATKRLAELVLQDLATRSTHTRYSMVRFGNVLGSSGSVLPLFQRQIRQGGPITVTHPDVTRFFMTIPEAARLVLLAAVFAKGGDVFILDMGKPMKIVDVARRMVEMSGASVQSPDNMGGIEIKITGLRPGEKLYEELLIDDDSLLPTPHAKILRADEARLSQIETARMLRDLASAVQNSDKAMVRTVIERDVQGYHRADLTGTAKPQLG
ncbi:polysaccharide biosynthesis protein [Octadecabacter sp. G9-8]|uniref:Polysaccharide biosynthesis protein n=1 Tax=Octadecabacter dasysiphoniae TaxID=2909341 RepID=A0ABS9CVN4_9RHOB|nr:nucleoside-diphosphate sugar epimerase/dehydratase [Octadecabacter dasysiphoniae]MCF2871340.1 polysaccharide biosynthesis protein [Octadecabacter dasysiphoniae]